jgi:pantoate--beta-alanine ligase
VIDEMVRDLAFNIRLLDGPTVRESDGLAMSSRNDYLSAEERGRSVCLWRGLQRGRQLLAAGERDAEAVVAAVTEVLRDTDQVEYVEIRSVPDLLSVRQVRGHVLLAVAARVGPARLIDNLVLRVHENNVVSAGLLGGDASE